MPPVTHPDASAFIRKYLECPADATTRLVFADWLEETDEPPNVAWAHFIRFKYEADLFPVGPERQELDRKAEGCAKHIRARLTVPAKLFVGYPKSLQQLLPIEHLGVMLAEFTVPRDVIEFVPESVARENLVIPIDAQERTLLIAAVEPRNYDTIQKLQFILNRDIVSVTADRDDLQAALDREYGPTETESVDSVLVGFTDAPITFTSTVPLVDPDSEYSPVARLVNLILQEAINMRADRVQVFPEPDCFLVRFRIDDAWVVRDRAPLRLLRPVARRFAIMTGIPIAWVSTTPPSLTPMSGQFALLVGGTRFRLTLTLQPSPDGPTLQIDLARDPPQLSDR